MGEEVEKLSDLEGKISDLTRSVQDIQVNQKTLSQHLKVANISNRLDGVEKRQEEVIRLLSNLRNELAGISSGMARRDSLMLGTGLTNMRRDSLILESSSRRGSVLLAADGLIGKGNTIPVMEVEPWQPSTEVQQIIDRLLERQFLLSPWMREKRLRNQLRLILKDYLDAGPQRRSTVTKIVHDAHQLFPVWRGQIKDAMFADWEKVQALSFPEAAEIIFSKFKKSRFSDETEAIQLYAEHMIEVGQYLRRKANERAEKAGRTPQIQGSITNSKFWYEVRKKINEILENRKDLDRRRSSSMAEQDSDEDESYHSPDEDQEKRTVNIPIYITSDQERCLEETSLENRLSADSGIDNN
ncbi:uncharacterized protein LOC111716418 [Eurytemora carolleeae]|uniref:uncharacterized protein LOC111716418 n=1 Tax=Eurytemora carolleeae TaxID=1294199 RepID=UPI000C7682AA|nr:uncharacterized protein LOC111716418 [Eurytemora carolleeae]|eukprot:XP_023347643.1 uncharacterized protein LOC111716418 [Eurytemora affinis]